MKYHKIIRDLREDNDKTQKELADYMGIDIKTYNRLENEKHQIKLDYAIEIAKFYNLSLDYITGLIDQPETLDRFKNHKNERR